MSWIIAGSALVGAAAGSMKDRSSQSSSSASGVNLAQQSELDKYGGQLTDSSLRSLEGMVNAGPGLSSIGEANSQYGTLASMLGDYSKNGGAPGQQDWLQANDFAKNQFAPQQMQIDQSFEAEQERAKQLAVQMGRSPNDPYIQAQLSKQKMQMQNMMGAQQGAFVGQEARNSAMGRLGFTSQLADLKGSLASQAMANRQALLSLGSGVQQQERNWRYQISDKWGKNNTEQESGGGMKGALTGAIAGAGVGMGMSGGMGSRPTSVTPGGGQTTGMLGVNTDLGFGGGGMAAQPFGMTQNFGQLGGGAPAMPQRGSRFAGGSGQLGPVYGGSYQPTSIFNPNYNPMR
jgi:hypothetical protein